MGIVFLTYIGTNHNGEYEYEALYAENPPYVWAEDFAEQVPSSCALEDLIPSDDLIDAKRRIISPEKILLAAENSCYSMQDCMDGILNLFWVETDTGYDGIGFGEDIDISDHFFMKHRCYLGDLEEVEHKTEEVNENDIPSPSGEYEDYITKVYMGDTETTEVPQKVKFEDFKIGKMEEEGKDDEDDDDIDLEELFNGNM